MNDGTISAQGTPHIEMSKTKPKEGKMKAKKRIYLTKGRLSALNYALSIDDILYEKHRRMMEELYIVEKRLHKKGNVDRVYSRDNNGDLWQEQILEVQTTPDGQVVYINKFK